MVSKKPVSILGVILLALAGIWFVAANARSGNSAGNFSIETAVIETGDVAKLVSASGSVRALTTVEVGSQVSGQIIELSADYNSEVESGEIIARIDSQTFETRVASAMADVSSAQAAMAVQRANIARAEATLAQADREYARQKGLFAADATALRTLEDTERALAVAQADLEVNRAQLQSASATLLQREASLRSAEVDLERTIIRSPINGVVISRDVDVGQTVAASFSAPVLFTIAQDLEDIRIDAAVVEADIGGINSGDLVTFTVDAYPEDKFTAEVEQVRLASEELQNVVTYTVVIAAQNPNGRLLPGMTANVEITVDKRQDVLRIADAAVRFRPPSNGPVIIEPQQGERRQGAGRPGGRGGVLRGLETLEISGERLTEIETAMRDAMQQIPRPSGNGRPVDRNAIRQRIQSVQNKVLSEYLTADEFKTIKAAQSQRPTTTRVEAYMKTATAELEKRTLVIGLQDGSWAEVLRGAEVGDEFVTRVLVDKDSN